MIITDAQLHTCISCAKNVKQQYTLAYLATDDPQQSVDYLVDLYSGALGKPRPVIVEVDIEAKNSPIYSSVFIKADGSIDIAIAKGLNFCQKRFVIAKELFHGLLDDDEYHNMDLFGHLNDVAASFPDRDATPGLPVASELLAEFAAMEFLFPYAKRVEELNMPGTPSFPGIALKYRVPLVQVEKYLTIEYIKNLEGY